MDIKLRNIILLRTGFGRGPELDVNEKTEIKSNINIEYQISDDKALVVSMFHYSVEIPNNNDTENQLAYTSTHYAELEIVDYKDDEECKEKIDKFINVNVGAMVFPFIREHLATTTMKAGMSPLIIPSVNFVERYKKKKEKSE